MLPTTLSFGANWIGISLCMAIGITDHHHVFPAATTEQLLGSACPLATANQYSKRRRNKIIVIVMSVVGVKKVGECALECRHEQAPDRQARERFRGKAQAASAINHLAC